MTNIDMKLDNAANIYPASLTKKYASLFRMGITLNEYVDSDVLEEALKTTVKRIPNFGCCLDNGFFWWNLKSNHRTPSLSTDHKLNRGGFDFKNGFLFKAFAEGCTIYLDVFHALTDGHGGETFLLTLTAEYLRLKHGLEIEYNDLVLDPREKPSKEMLADRFRMFSGKKGQLDSNEIAYHIPGTKSKYSALHNERIIMPIEDVKATAKEYGCTITELLAASMLEALQDVHRADMSKNRKNVLKISVPIDLRNIYSVKTLRNFSSYIFVGVDVTNGYLSFEELIETVIAQKKYYLLHGEIEKKVAGNVNLEDNKGIAIIPRFIKKPIIDLVAKVKGDRYCSQTISNLGNVELPESIRPYIKEMDFVLGRQRGTSGAAACVSCNGKLFLNVSRNIRNSYFEDCFVAKLRELGIMVTRRSQELGTIDSREGIFTTIWKLLYEGLPEYTD
ncbi:MAG: hypothetical protein MJY83_01245 [Bacteroidales bacterium]|nr:hypothetical protein [Bacteroidales bacterium]